MATKAQIETAITDRTTGSLTVMTWEKHAEMLKTEDTSILENIYGEPVQEYSEGTHLITTPNANFTYFANFTKVGRSVTITGVFTPQNTILNGLNNTIFTIDISEYTCISERFYSVCRATASTDFINIYMSGTTLKSNNTLTAGNTYSFTLTYSTLD